MVHKKYLIVIIIAAIIICVGAGVFVLTSSSGSDEEERMVGMISDFALRLGLSSDESEQKLMTVAQNLGKISADDPGVSKILMDFYTQSPSVNGALRINEKGEITTIAPATQTSMYRYLIPADYISDNLGTYGVYLDHLYNIETGDTQVVLGAPVYSNGAYTGMITAIYNPISMIGSALGDIRNQTGYTIWVLDGEGTILYCSGDSTSIGTNMRSTASVKWPQIAPLVPEILKEKSGVSKESAYSYLQMKNIDRIVAWDTVNKWDEDITVVMANDVSGGKKFSLPTKESGLTLEQYAFSAYRYVKDHGKEAALEEFNNPNGEFFTSDFMFASLDMNETLLSDPYHPELIGVSRTNYLDEYGVPINKMMTMRAHQGGGYALYLMQDPQDNMETKMLVGYVMPIDDDWYAFAGSFVEEPVEVQPELKDELVKFTRSIHQFIDDVGREAALDSLNNENEQFLHPLDIQYVIFDYDGTALSWPNHPEVVGQDALGVTDVYGGSIVRDAIMYAKDGGGFMYHYYPDAITGESSLKLVYVEPLGDDCVLAANIPIM